VPRALRTERPSPSHESPRDERRIRSSGGCYLVHVSPVTAVAETRGRTPITGRGIR
jgi:hypothetical protein